MVKSLIALCSIPAALGNSVQYDAQTHVPHSSSGCGSAPAYTKGQSTKATVKFQGDQYTYRVYVPSSYNKNTPMPVIMQFHGWGMNAKSEESGGGIQKYAEEKGYIAVHPQGQDDNKHSGGPWYSWNCVGTTKTPGPEGPTCNQQASYPSYCYDSCSPCSARPQCEWTTCKDEITPTGTGKTPADGFIVSLYNTLESQLCVDTTREYIAGESNGGMMAYHVGAALPERWAAIAPQFGSFHKGYLMSPSTGLPIIDIHGKNDKTVPANSSTSSGGYFYTTVKDIFEGNKEAPGWKKANGCSGGIKAYPTEFDGQSGLSCVSEGECTGGDVVRCSWNGGHNWYGNSAKLNGGLVTDFLLKWTKPTFKGGSGEVFQDITITEDEITPVRDLSSVLTSRPEGHYGHPAHGCLETETAISLADGIVCAPKIDVDAEAESEDGLPVPKCRIGVLNGLAGESGCPRDAHVGEDSKSFPICMAAGETDTPFENGEFACMLACPCEVEVNEDGTVQCNDDSHSHCQRGAYCRRGETREMSYGVCTFPSQESIFA
jgi:polyhydroxybutyrate depolymerase